MNSSEDRKVQSSTLSSLLSYFSQINLWNSQSVCDDSGLVHLNESTTLLEKSNEGRSKFADAQSFDEISTFINERQAALQGELRTINGTTAYHIAKLQAPAFVRDLEVVFLRAEDWNETRASIRMLNFFEAKQSLFGTPALGRQLQITDLDCEALKCLRSGTFQILSSRDKQSRRVLCFFPCNHTDGQIASLVKAWWFFVMRIVETGNPKFLRSDFVGVVFIDSSIGLMQLDHHLYWHALCSLRQLPLKISEWHCCHDSFYIDTALPIFSYYYGKEDQMNSLHLHKGSRTECAYSLMKSGLPAHELPLTEEGSVELKTHYKWLHDYCDIP